MWVGYRLQRSTCECVRVVSNFWAALYTYVQRYSIRTYIYSVVCGNEKKNIEEKNSTLTALARKRRAEKHVKSNTSTRVYIYMSCSSALP